MNYDFVAAIQDSLRVLITESLTFMPQLVGALVVLVVGWILGGFLGKLVAKAFVKLKLDVALDKAGVDDLSERAGYAFRPAKFVGGLVKWFIILAFVVVAFDVLNLESVTVFMREVVLGYLPQVFAGILILFAGMIIAGVAETLASGAVRSTGAGSNPTFFGKVAYYAVLVFSAMAALNQMQIADELIQTLFMGIVFALSLGLGLAFGLGGRDAAARYIDKATSKKTSE